MDKMTGIFKRVIAYLLRRLGCSVHIVNSSQVSSLPLLTKAHLKKKQCCSVLAKDAATCAGRLCDCLLWRRGSKTAAPRAAVPTRGLPAAQKRARRAENEENDVNFYNATRKAESSLQHRTGSPESRCCRDLVQAPVYFFYCALEFNISPAHTFRPSSLAPPTPASAKPGDGIQHHLREFDTGAAKFTCRNISTEETPHIHTPPLLQMVPSDNGIL